MTEEQERIERRKYEEERYADYLKWRKEEEKAREERIFRHLQESIWGVTPKK